MAWTKMASKADLAEGDVLGLSAGDKQIALYFYEGSYFATSNICTHQFALLSEGYFEDGCIECPLHQGRFDVRTGEAQCAPLTENISTYPIKVDDESIYVDL
ncbi:MAG TPA: non-heme iron oxygenase ferredoxin subunit [Herbaspirillum sp.]|jgi:nitrite reductase/ring-hydroxylating ferredoxin subunit